MIAFAGTGGKEVATLNLEFVDEVIKQRREQHGGGRGAPPLTAAGIRTGASLNRSVIVLLSAQLQAYVEEVFKACAEQALPSVKDTAVWPGYWKLLDRWGNPNPNNIRNLFLRIGVANVLAGLSWKGCANATVTKKLDHLNQIRNDIAHGGNISVDGKSYNLTLAQAEGFRTFAFEFAKRFEKHALKAVK